MDKLEINSTIKEFEDLIYMYSDEVDRYKGHMTILNKDYSNQNTTDKKNIVFFNMIVDRMDKKVNDGLDMLSNIIEDYDTKDIKKTANALTEYNNNIMEPLGLLDLKYLENQNMISNLFNGN